MILKADRTFLLLLFFSLLLSTAAIAEATRVQGTQAATDATLARMREVQRLLQSAATDNPDPTSQSPLHNAKQKLDAAKEKLRQAEQKRDQAKKPKEKAKIQKDEVDPAQKEKEDAEKEYNEEKEKEIERRMKELEELQKSLEANDPEKHGGGGSGGGEKGKGGQPPQAQPPQQQDKGDDNQQPPENPQPEPQIPDPKKAEAPKVEDEQILDLGKEEIPEVAEIEVPEVLPIEFPEEPQQIQPEQTATLEIPPPPPQQAAVSTPGSTAITVDETQSFAGEGAPVGTTTVAAPTGSGGSPAAEIYVSGSGILEDGELNRAIKSYTGGGRGAGGGEGGNSGGGSNGVDLNAMMAGLSGSTLGGGSLSGASSGGLLVGGKSKNATKRGVKGLKVSKAMRAYLAMNNRRVLGSTRKYRNRIILSNSKARVKRGYVPAGYYNRVGKRIEWDPKTKSVKKPPGPGNPPKVSKAKRQGPKKTLNSGRLR